MTPNAVTIDMLRAEVARLEKSRFSKSSIGMSSDEIVEILGIGTNRARKFIRNACESGLLKCQMVECLNVMGTAQWKPRYFFVQKERRK